MQSASDLQEPVLLTGAGTGEPAAVPSFEQRSSASLVVLVPLLPLLALVRGAGTLQPAGHMPAREHSMPACTRQGTSVQACRRAC